MCHTLGGMRPPNASLLRTWLLLIGPWAIIAVDITQGDEFVFFDGAVNLDHRFLTPAGLDGHSNAVVCWGVSGLLRCTYLTYGDPITKETADKTVPNGVSVTARDLTSAALDASSTIVCYRNGDLGHGTCNYLKIVESNVDVSRISSSAEVVLEPVWSFNPSVAGLSSSSAVVCYADHDFKLGKCNHLSADAATLTLTAATTFHLESEEIADPSVAGLTSSRVIVCYVAQGSTSYDRRNVCSLLNVGSEHNSTTLLEPAGTVKVVSTEETSYCKVVALSSGTAIVCYTSLSSGDLLCNRLFVVDTEADPSLLSAEAALNVNTKTTGHSTLMTAMAPLDGFNAIACYTDRNSGSGTQQQGICRCLTVDKASGALSAGTAHELNHDSPSYERAAINTNSMARIDDRAALVCYGDDGNSQKGTCATLSIPGAASGSAGDPHLKGAHGDEADFKGEDHGVYNYLTAKNISLNVLVEHDTFRSPYSKLDVNGSWVRGAFHVLRTGTSARLLHVHFLAADPHRAVVTEACAVAGCKNESAARPANPALTRSLGRAKWQHRIVANAPALRIENVAISLKERTLTISTGRWRTTCVSTASAPHWRSLRMNIEMKPTYAVDSDVVAPHGLLGQVRAQRRARPRGPPATPNCRSACDGPHAPDVQPVRRARPQTYDRDNLRVNGRRDSYARLDNGRRAASRKSAGGTVTTRAAAQGFMEGALDDYRMASSFATAFRFSRFDARAAGVRNVSALAGTVLRRREHPHPGREAGG